MAPEVAFGEELDFSLDVWSLGASLFYIWTKQHLYDRTLDRAWKFFLRDGGLAMADQLPTCANLEIWLNNPNVPPDYHQVLEKLPAVQSLSPLQLDLLSQMMKIDPESRIPAEQILNHEWFHEQQQP